MSRWFRVYDDLVDDPKVQQLPPAAFRGLVNLWCLASKNAGKLPPLSEIAFKLRLTEVKADALLRELRSANLLDDDADGSGTIRPHNWNGRQFKSDNVSDRVKKHREKHRTTVTSNDDETLHETPPETDTETEKKIGGVPTPPEPFVFVGKIVRLKAETYSTWREAYPHVPDLKAELTLADDYYSEHRPPGGKWFFPVSRWLAKANTEALAAKTAPPQTFERWAL